MKLQLPLAAVVLLTCAGVAPAQYTGWKHSGSVYVITTPEGAKLPGGGLG